MATNYRLPTYLGYTGVAAGAYLAYAAKLECPELCMAAAGGTLGALATCQLRRLDGVRQALTLPPPAWLGQLARKMVSDSGAVLMAITRSLFLTPTEGRLRAVPFEPGGDDPRSLARCTWVTLAKSLTPNGVVIVIDRPNQRLLLHELAAGGATGTNREWPS